MHQTIIELNKKFRDKKMPEFRSGDIVRVYRKIKEGDKERIQMFEGMVIAIKGHQSSSPTMTVRKTSFGIGVELIVPLYSPSVEKIELVKRTKSRQSKVYFVREKAERELKRKLKETAISEQAVTTTEEETTSPEGKADDNTTQEKKEQPKETKPETAEQDVAKEVKKEAQKKK